jgi:hypothetical protein
MSFAIIFSILKMEPHFRNYIHQEAISANKTIDYESQEKITINSYETYFLSKHCIETRLSGLPIDAIICDAACLLDTKDVERIYQLGMPCMLSKPFVYFMFIE